MANYTCVSWDQRQEFKIGSQRYGEIVWLKRPISCLVTLTGASICSPSLQVVVVEDSVGARGTIVTEQHKLETRPL